MSIAAELPGLRHRDDTGRRARSTAAWSRRRRRCDRRRGDVRATKRRKPAPNSCRSSSTGSSRSRRPLRSGDHFQVWSIGGRDSAEDELLRRFFGGLDKLRPTLVSWNGSGFDLPVLHYRMLLHGIAAPTYWDTGDLDRDFRWNNYLNRYPLPAPGPDGRAVRLPGARARESRSTSRRCSACPASLAWRATRSGRHGAIGRIGRDPRLLRNRRAQHLPDLPAFRADPRPSDAADYAARSRGCAPGSRSARKRTGSAFAAAWNVP